MNNTINTGTKTSSRFASTIKISAVVAACFAFTACGAITEKITEEGAERIIEAETGENVELDFDSGDGSFSIQTEDGGFSLDEDGSFVVTDDEGSVFTGNADDNGLVVFDDDGNPVVDVDVDANGETGEISVQGENGDSVYRTITEIPAEWPSEIPRPDGLPIEAGTYVAADGEVMMTLVGAPANGAIDFTEQYGAALVAAGLAETGRYDASQDGSTTAQRSFEGATWTVNINGFEADGSNTVNLSIYSTGS